MFSSDHSTEQLRSRHARLDHDSPGARPHSSTWAAWSMTALLLLLLPWDVPAQTRDILGTVRDANTMRPVPDVRIRVRADAVVLTITDARGEFRISAAKSPADGLLVFEHVSFEARTVRADSLRMMKDVLLQPRVIPMRDVEVTGSTGPQSVRHAELPHLAVELDARSYEAQGYVDAGDLLRTNAAVQVDEQFSGSKTLSLRGGNADDVVVLYDGVRLNSAFDNTVDLSTIDLADIERLEIIKGGSTVLFGPDAPSGIVNIIPKVERDYLLRFQQQIGSYDAGTWGLQAYKALGGWSGSYSLRSGAQARTASDTPGKLISNGMLQHTATAAYRFGADGDALGRNTVSAHAIYGTQDYENDRDAEEQHDRSFTVVGRYRGDIARWTDFHLMGSAATMDRTLSYNESARYRERRFLEHTYQAEVGKSTSIGAFDVTAGYQYHRSGLDVTERSVALTQQLIDLSDATFTRDHHGLLGIVKLHTVTDDDFFRGFDVDLSARHDIVHDATADASGIQPGSSLQAIAPQTRSKTLVKFASLLTGVRDDMVFRFFLSYGNAIKFPTLQQQMSMPVSGDTAAALRPETAVTTEMAMTITRERLGDQVFNGWLVSLDYFQCAYSDKMRTISLPGTPILQYDNVQDAEIRGLEGQLNLYMLKKKLTIEAGASRYFIPNASAFPFKSDLKATLGARIEHLGFTLHAMWFTESEQIGLLRGTDGEYLEMAIPAFSAFDVHAGATFGLGPLRCFANVSGRNLFGSGNVELRGLALHDRRYYITAGVQI
jgi:outer membrane cobalamin receptor